jgi:hypothetical protein
MLPYRTVIPNVDIPSDSSQNISYQDPTKHLPPLTPQPWELHYLNWGIIVDQQLAARAQKELDALLLYWKMRKLVPDVRPAQSAYQFPFPTAAPTVTQEVSQPQEPPRQFVTSTSTMPPGIRLSTPSASSYDTAFSSPLGFSDPDPNAIFFLPSPPTSHPTLESQQPATVAHLGDWNGLDLSPYENTLVPQDPWWQNFLHSPQGVAIAPGSTCLGKRRRDDTDIESLGNEHACRSLFSPADVQTPHEFSGGVCNSYATGVSGPSSSRATKVARNRNTAVKPKPKPKRQPKVQFTDISGTQDTISSSAVGRSQDHSSQADGPGTTTNGFYLGPAVSIGHWLRNVYRNNPDGPCLSSSSGGDAPASIKGKGKMKTIPTGAVHLSRIPVNRLKHCVFCGERSETMPRHLETHPRHGGGSDGWAVVTSKGGIFPSGKRLIEAILLMCFATAKKGYEDPWTEGELAARESFVERFSNVDISDEGNPTVAQASIPGALKDRFVNWCKRLSSARFCHKCDREFARADSYKRHVKKCGAEPERGGGKDQLEASPSSSTMFPTSSSVGSYPYELTPLRQNLSGPCI